MEELTGLRVGIERELRRLHDDAVALAKELGFKGNDRKILAALNAESDFYARTLTSSDDDQGDLCTAHRGAWMRQFSKPVVARICCISALEVLLNPLEPLENGFRMSEWLTEIERYISVANSNRAVAVKVPAPPKDDLNRHARLNKAREQIRTLEHEIAIARSELCDCAA
jgi:hypothetical protein